MNRQTRRTLALAACMAGVPSLALAQATIFSDSFNNISSWTDLSSIPTSALNHATAFDNATTPGVVTLNAASISQSGYTAASSLKTFTGLDRRLTTPIDHGTNVVTIDFTASWAVIPSSTSGENGRFIVSLNYGYPSAGLNTTQEGVAGNKVGDFSNPDGDPTKAWWARPAYHLRVRNGNNASTMLQYGGGQTSLGEYEKYGNGVAPDPDWHLPGFISGAGGTSPGTLADYPANSWVQTTGAGLTTIANRNFRYRVEPSQQQVFVDTTYNPDGSTISDGTLRATMPLLQSSAAPLYQYFTTFEGVRLYWRGASALTQQAKLDSIKLMVSPVDLSWDTVAGTSGAQGGTGTWDNASAAAWWNASFTTRWQNANALLGGANPATFAGTAGTVTVAGGVTASSLTFSTSGYVLSGGTITLTGPTLNAAADATINSALVLPTALTKSGVGALAINGPQTYASPSTLTATAGTLNLNSDGGTNLSAATNPTGGNVSLNLGASQHLAALALGASGANTTSAVLIAGGGKTLVTRSLTISGPASAPTSVLDLTDNALIIDYSGAVGTTLSNVVSQIRAARNGFDVNTVTNWNGKGIKSSSARTNSAASGFDLYSIGTINNASLADPNIGRDPYATIRGQSLDATSVIARYTYSGDADLNGFVDGDDYALIDNAYNLLIANFGWLSGDFNYDGNIDGDDYALIDSGYLFQGAPIAGAAVAVPEPASMLCLSAGALGLLSRRHRNSVAPR